MGRNHRRWTPAWRFIILHTPSPLLPHVAILPLYLPLSSCSTAPPGVPLPAERALGQQHRAAKTWSLFAHLLPKLQHPVRRLASGGFASMQKPLLNTRLAAEHHQEPDNLPPPRWKGRINGFSETAKSNNYTDRQPAVTLAWATVTLLFNILGHPRGDVTRG